MSYDFDLFPPVPGLDAIAAYQRYGERVEERNKLLAENRVWHLDPVEEARNVERNRRLADLLREISPDFEAAAVDLTSLVSAGKISEAMAKWVSLTTYLTSPSLGVEVSLSVEGAGIRVAYWHDKDKAKRVFDGVWRCLETLVREAHYLIFDPQIDSIVDLSLDFPRILERYDEGVRYLRKIAPAVTRGRERPDH